MTLAIGGDLVEDITVSGKQYRVHQFTSPVMATFNNGAAKLQSDTNEVGTRTIAAGDVVYVEDSSDADQIGNTYKASGSTDDWTWTLYGLTVTKAGEVEYLIVAGGGGGGNVFAGGGGAGGYRSAVIGENSGGGTSAESPLQLSLAAYPVIVGRGGVYQENGHDSSISTVSATGGGRGSQPGTGGFVGGHGGSGGGGSYNRIHGNGIAGQGFDGGIQQTQVAASRAAGSGGGGASETGVQAPDYDNGGAGGSGVSSAITGDILGRAGGGGGAIGINSLGVPGTASDGGGAGAQGSTEHGQNGSDNTGGGGGGAGGHVGSSARGGSGGSGIVIVRYELVSLRGIPVYGARLWRPNQPRKHGIFRRG